MSLNLSEWHSDSQDPQVYDEPAASEEANGKRFSTHFYVSAVVIGISYRNFIVVGRRRPSSRQGNSPQDWNQGEACKDVQDHPWCCLRVRLQNSVWRRQDHRLRHGVRLPRLCQEERAQTQTGQSECCYCTSGSFSRWFQSAQLFWQSWNSAHWCTFTAFTWNLH